MVWDKLAQSADDENQRHRDRLIGIYIGVLAVILAVCSTGGDNAAKEATRKNIASADTWAFFQAKNARRQMLRLQVDEFEALKATQPSLPDAAKSAIDAKIAGYKDTDARLTSEPDTGEGLDELFTKGKALEAERDRALRQDPYFDYGQAFLQIAIVLASVAIISTGNALLVVSAILGVAGTLLTVNGFTLAVAIPFLG